MIGLFSQFLQCGFKKKNSRGHNLNCFVLGTVNLEHEVMANVSLPVGVPVVAWEEAWAEG